VHTALPLEEVREAHRTMEAGDHVGKIVLTAR
jgi:NADPH:quinone reductase-like Zn-dependent oxidoreductase